MATLPCFQSHKFDEAYLRALRAQNAEIEAHFVRYFTPLIQIKLRKRKCAPDQVQDVLQETLLRVLKLVRGEFAVRQPERFGALVNSVCTNVLRESYRARTRYDALDDLQIDPPDKAARPDEMLAAKELRSKVQQILSGLSERDRDLLKFVFLEERDKDEVCEKLGVTRDYLRVLLCRAKEQFQKVYESESSQPVKAFAHSAASR
jgi:RNA polymerase sigma-70 factor (ECF subfamily)